MTAVTFGNVLELIVHYGAPTMGCVMANAMFAAPVADLRQALLLGSLGSLNPFPWAIMSGNCLGWVVYGYYTSDCFVVAANMPGLILSFWLNSGAAKLQYLQLVREHKNILALESINSGIPGATNDNANSSSPIRSSNNSSASMQHREQWDAIPESSESDQDVEVDETVADDTDVDPLILREMLVSVPQELALLRVLTFWALVLTYVGWFATNKDAPAEIIGIIVNVNLVFFYGAPLQTIHTVIKERTSASIHLPTLFMNYTNTVFWIIYGYSRRDPFIIVPNILGLTTGILQGILCLSYPRVRTEASEPLNATEPIVLASGDREIV